MKLKVNGVLFEVVLSFASPGSVAPWQAEAYHAFDLDIFNGNFDAVVPIVASGTTPDTALQALAISVSEMN